MIRNLTSVGIVAGLVLVLGWIGSRYLILRPIQALVNFTARLGAGDHSARTGLPRARDELRQLMRAFDQMAEALQQREAERQSADHALKASEMRYRRLFETAQDGILILNAGTGQIDDVNPFLTICWATLASSCWETNSGRLALSKTPKRPRRSSGSCSVKPMSVTTTCRWKPATAGPSTWSLSATSIRSTAAKSFNATFATLPSASRPRENSRNPATRLQVLSRRLVEVQETERRHLARELHDEIGQALTVAEMNLQALLQSPGTDALAPRLKESLDGGRARAGTSA